jgi:hypothetical protein
MPLLCKDVILLEGAAVLAWELGHPFIAYGY